MNHVKNEELKKIDEIVEGKKPYKKFVLNTENQKTLEKRAAIFIAEKVQKLEIGVQDGQRIYAVQSDPRGAKGLHLKGFAKINDGTQILIAAKLI